MPIADVERNELVLALSHDTTRDLLALVKRNPLTADGSSRPVIHEGRPVKPADTGKSDPDPNCGAERPSILSATLK